MVTLKKDFLQNINRSFQRFSVASCTQETLQFSQKQIPSEIAF